MGLSEKHTDVEGRSKHPYCLTRRGFLAAAAGGLIAAPEICARPKLAIGHQQTRMQPSGSLTPDETLALAHRMVEFHARGENRLSPYPVFLLRAAATGSMRPAIGDGDIVIMEAAPFLLVGIGDVVWLVDQNHTAWTPEGTRGAVSVMHRITGGTPAGWITRGDNNLRADHWRVTGGNYRARVCQVLHCRKERLSADALR